MSTQISLCPPFTFSQVKKNLPKQVYNQRFP
nr:MAG TPA: hypothetical protein [Caudoviricetes sp.]